MKDIMEYNGYRGAVHYSAEDGVFFGKVLGIADLVNFEGDDVRGLERAFREAVDDYLELCAKRGREPERGYSGNIALRIGSDLHQRIAIAAELEDKSLNGWIAEALEDMVREKPSGISPRRAPVPRKKARKRTRA
jgi:predicted HicB family RNase H-like nuclease